MNVGDIVVVKLTGEPVIIDGFVENEQIIVRRAVQSQDGLVYVSSPFSSYELLTQEDWFRQDLEIKYKFHEIRESFERRLAKSNPDTLAPASALTVN